MAVRASATKIQEGWHIGCLTRHLFLWEQELVWLIDGTLVVVLTAIQTKNLVKVQDGDEQRWEMGESIKDKV